jgi:hypothetical protein
VVGIKIDADPTGLGTDADGAIGDGGDDGRTDGGADATALGAAVGVAGAVLATVVGDDVTAGAGAPLLFRARTST